MNKQRVLQYVPVHNLIRPEKSLTAHLVTKWFNPSQRCKLSRFTKFYIWWWDDWLFLFI